LLISEFFLGGWISPLFVLTSVFLEEIIFLIFEIIFFVNTIFFIRGLLPRFRYDQLMKLNWNIFIPLIIFVFYYLVGILLYI
jgi:NADH-quinone oxidoreductase subunit H